MGAVTALSILCGRVFQMTNRFDSIEVGSTFDYGGNVYRKRSTRTAEIVLGRTYNPDELRWAIHDDHAGTWAYFSQGQRVNQESHWWNAMQHGRALKGL